MTAAQTELNEATNALRGLHARRTALLAELREVDELLPQATQRRDKASALLRVPETTPPLPPHLAELRTRVEKTPRGYDPSAVKEAPPAKF